MTLQNVSIVLSPTMQISHRVLNIFFAYSKILFRDTVIKRYRHSVVVFVSSCVKSPVHNSTNNSKRVLWFLFLCLGELVSDLTK